jgi:hypothetical protein
MNGARSKSVASQTRRTVLTAAAMVAFCLPSAVLFGERQNPARPAPNYPAPRQQSSPRATHPQSPRQNQGRPSPQYPSGASPNRIPQYQPYRAPGGGGAQRPIQSPYVPQTGIRRAYPGTAQQLYAPPGHLGAWLNTHRNVPVPQQQQMLRNDPSFRRLPQGEQQRVMNQLNRVNQLPDAQRERRLARAENLERLSPEDRARVAQSARQWTALPPDRQTTMRNAFRDLRAVPPDQRSIVLNSSRYQSQFSPQERGILSDMLRVEPYAPPQ